MKKNKPQYSVLQRLEYITTYVENLKHDVKCINYSHHTKSDLKKIQKHIDWINNKLGYKND